MLEILPLQKKKGLQLRRAAALFDRSAKEPQRKMKNCGSALWEREKVMLYCGKDYYDWQN
jgi:hypothetical protein